MDRDEKTPSRRIARELETVRTMIGMYCDDHHEPSVQLCDDCEELYQYVEKRVSNCPFGKDKPTCAKCSVHCFRKTMRERIRQVMRYAGPKMALSHPVLSVFHFLDGRRPTPENKKTSKDTN